MKKIKYVLGALVLGFLLTSCESKKDQVINLFNTFFDEEVAALSKVMDADAFLEYFYADSLRYEKLNDTINKDFPVDSLDRFIGMNQQDSDAAWKVFNDREEDYTNQFNSKGAALYEPYISDAENAFLEMMNFLDQYERIEDVPEDEFNALYEQFLEKFEAAEKYMPVSDTAQYERFLNLAETIDDEDDVSEK